MRQRLKSGTSRRLALGAIAVVALGSYALSPAIGGPAKLTEKRAKKLFFTKTESNNRYYSKDVANARFLPRQSGEYEFTLDPHDWNPGSSGAAKQTPAPPNGGFVRFLDNDADNVLGLHAGALPSEFAGKGLRLSAIEICFELSNAVVDRLEVFRSGPIGADPVPAQVLWLDDQTDLAGPECHRYVAPPALVDGSAVLDLELTVDYTAAGSVEIGRTAAIFTP